MHHFHTFHPGLCILCLPVMCGFIAASLAAEPETRYSADKSTTNQNGSRQSNSPKAAGAADPSITPVYRKDGSLLRPNEFRTWVFVGAAKGLPYSENDDDSYQSFNNVYIDPAAYRHYARTGDFPEKTMLAMTIYRASQKQGEWKQLRGSFEDELVSLEVAVKDSQQFEEGWGYFDFGADDSKTDTAKPFATARCYDCHVEHAADDNVFTQFYPVLRRLKQQRKRPLPSKSQK